MTSKRIKRIETKDFYIELTHAESGRYVISYEILGRSFTVDDIAPFEMATILFDRKLEEMQAYLPTYYVL